MKVEMTSAEDLVTSVISLDMQAKAQAARGTRQDMKDCYGSLRAIVADCHMALQRTDLSDEYRKWFESQHDSAASLLV